MCHQDDRLAAPDRGRLRSRLDVDVVSAAPMPTVLERARPGVDTGAVVIVTDIYGATPFYQGLAARLAEDGFTTAVPDFLLHQAGELEVADREHALARMRDVDQQQALADVAAVTSWLRAESGVDRVGMLGFCLGGTFALDLAAQRDDLAVVSFYGFPDGVPGTNPAPAPRTITDRIAGPILGLWGEQDYMDMNGVREFCATLADHNRQFTHHLYPGAGHGFLGDLTDNGDAAVDAWARTTRFFTEQLQTVSNS